MAPIRVKVGPWGTSGGTPCDINRSSIPQRLVSISIWSNETPGGCINGFAFTYVDQKDVHITVGIGGCATALRAPWRVASMFFPPKKTITMGTWSPHYCRGRVKTIKVPENLQVLKVSGTSNETGVTSLKLHVGNKKKGPYGWPAGPKFSLPLWNGGAEVISFFGTSGDNLKSLGVYVITKGILYTAVEKEVLVDIGPWGPWGRSLPDTTFWHINTRTTIPEHLQSITIRSSERSGGRVYGFSYTYIDNIGETICVGPWGSETKGQKHEFSMNRDNYINFMSGTRDEYGITSLKFSSTQDVYGPFGCTMGTTFSIFIQENAAIVSFYGVTNSDSLVNLGANVMPEDY